MIGQPIDRIDGRAKVTGRAPYAYDIARRRAAAYGVIVGAHDRQGPHRRASTPTRRERRRACCWS